jgi:hypothetical protein
MATRSPCDGDCTLPQATAEVSSPPSPILLQVCNDPLLAVRLLLHNVLSNDVRWWKPELLGQLWALFILRSSVQQAGALLG